MSRNMSWQGDSYSLDITHEMFAWILKASEDLSDFIGSNIRCMLQTIACDQFSGTKTRYRIVFHCTAGLRVEASSKTFRLIVVGWIFNKPFAVESEANAELFINSASLLCLAFHFVCCFVERSVAYCDAKLSTSFIENIAWQLSTSSSWKFIFLFHRMFTAPFPPLVDLIFQHPFVVRRSRCSAYPKRRKNHFRVQ